MNDTGSQAVVEWLESDEGIEWSCKTHRHAAIASQGVFGEVKEDKLEDVSFLCCRFSVQGITIAGEESLGWVEVEEGIGLLPAPA